MNSLLKKASEFRHPKSMKFRPAVKKIVGPKDAEDFRESDFRLTIGPNAPKTKIGQPLMGPFAIRKLTDPFAKDPEHIHPAMMVNTIKETRDLSQNFQSNKLANPMTDLTNLINRAKSIKAAFQAAPMDPAMAGGPPPMPPQGMPPMDPSMAGGPPPAPMDPYMGGMPPQGGPEQILSQLEPVIGQIMQAIEMISQEVAGLKQNMEAIGQDQAAISQVVASLQGANDTISKAMGGVQPPPQAM